MKILHLGGCDKFLPPFIDLIKENFDFKEHEFLLTSGIGEVKHYENVKVFEYSIPQRLKYYFYAFLKMHISDKVVLHGIFDIKLVFILFFTPWLLKKCYWVIWGGDLYSYQLSERNNYWKCKEFFRRPVIKNIGHLVTYIDGDVELTRKWYGAIGKYHECLMYTSNLYKEYNIPVRQSNITNIQVGNSADPSNNHFEILEKLLPFKEQNITIYVPLSYGDPIYAQKVIHKGQEWFGDKFKPLTDFIPFDQYLKLLGTINIAIFNHKRQQAMGNTITLLSLGKTVYLRSDTTQWQFFQKKGLIVGDVSEMNSLKLLEVEDNRRKVELYFSKENLINQINFLRDK